MIYYDIKERPEKTETPDRNLFSAIATKEEWKCEAKNLGFETPSVISFDESFASVIDVTHLGISGDLVIPFMSERDDTDYHLYFAINEHSIVFIDDTGLAETIIDHVISRKLVKEPCLEHFIYDFLEGIIRDDLKILTDYEKQLSLIEDRILEGKEEVTGEEINEIRGHLLDLQSYYRQMEDLGQELEENENEYFREEKLKYFRLFTDRAGRLLDSVRSLRDYSVQVRDLRSSVQGDKLNHNMAVLTVITTIFMPLTLIAGWYGMNFVNMPELHSKYGYPIVIVVSILVIILSLHFFRKKKWF